MPSFMISRMPPRTSRPSFCASASRMSKARASFFRRLEFGTFKSLAIAAQFGERFVLKFKYFHVVLCMGMGM